PLPELLEIPESSEDSRAPTRRAFAKLSLPGAEWCQRDIGVPSPTEKSRDRRSFVGNERGGRPTQRSGATAKMETGRSSVEIIQLSESERVATNGRGGGPKEFGPPPRSHFRGEARSRGALGFLERAGRRRALEKTFGEEALGFLERAGRRRALESLWGCGGRS